MTTEKIHFTKEKETMLMLLNGRAILNNLFRGQPMIFLNYIMATGFPSHALEAREAQSMAFFSTPGTE